jgi:hypothetical protein
MTQREKFIIALTKLGETEVKSRSSKFLTFTKKGGGFWFIGKSGSLRTGATSSRSYAVIPQTKQRLLQFAEAK